MWQTPRGEGTPARPCPSASGVWQRGDAWALASMGLVQA